jgi:hypothetical protein
VSGAICCPRAPPFSRSSPASSTMRMSVHLSSPFFSLHSLPSSNASGIPRCASFSSRALPERGGRDVEARGRADSLLGGKTLLRWRIAGPDRDVSDLCQFVQSIRGNLTKTLGKRMGSHSILCQQITAPKHSPMPSKQQNFGLSVVPLPYKCQIRKRRNS